MVVDKPDWSQASYQEMNDLVIGQGARISQLSGLVQQYGERNDRQVERIAELEERLEQQRSAYVSVFARAHKAEERIAQLEAENSEFRQRWADMCAGMRKIDLLLGERQGKDGG